MTGDNCTSTCETKDHETWGECVRAKGLRVAYCGQGGLDASTQRRWDAELALYKDARAQGVQPSSTKREAVERALKISEKTGTAFQA